MNDWDRQWYTGLHGELFGPLLAVDRLPELGPGSPDEQYQPQLAAAARSGFAHVEVREPLAAKAFMAGLWLYFDFLDESHDVSQSQPDEWGAYWHGIMHRREPDPSNAAYLFRRVRRNPILDQLKACAETVGYKYLDSMKFIDDCELARGSGDEQERRLRLVQMSEMRLLMDWNFAEALGKA